MYPDLYRLLIALGIGVIIGAEREYRRKSAGLRTMIMVSLSSCQYSDRAGFVGEGGDF